MSESKVVFSGKVVEECKELIAMGAKYLNLSQGTLVFNAVKSFINTTDYLVYLNNECKKNGLNLTTIIHESIKLETKKLLERPSLIEDFYEIYSLASEELFEDIEPDELTLDIIEESDYFPEWESYIREEIREAAVNRINEEIEGILNISGNLLMVLMPNLERMMNAEIEIEISLADVYRPIELTYYVDLICQNFNKTGTPFSGFHQNMLNNFINELTEDEERWIYTVFILTKNEFRNKIPPLDKAKDFLNQIFTQNEYAIFKWVSVETIVEKAINTPKVNSVWS